ncbi:hypothetical protein [Hamadaea tsunoensis]|uniref:hypothetical protein n=1 Tax=Hamadaea tsunoensis TaxID=53368 RepID=UPI0003F7AC6E|nr:hypothetical protein [Hamadaea tsunoensis]
MSRTHHITDVRVQLIGRDIDVTRLLDILRELLTINDLTHLIPVDEPHVALQMTVSRRTPYSGGTK